MTAGMPGTGIGSLFYVLLAIWMPCRELFALIQGRSSWKRWRFIAGQWAMLGAILVSMWYFVELLRWCYLKAAEWVTGGAFQPPAETSRVAFAAAWGGFITLSFVITAVFVMRAVVRWRRSRGTLRSATRPLAGLQPTLAASALRERVGLEAAK